MEQQIAEQGILEILNLTHALTGVGGSGLTAIIFGLIYKLTKSNLREGLVEESELEKFKEDLKKEIEEDFKEHEGYLQTLDGKEQKLRDRVSKLEGKLEK